MSPLKRITLIVPFLLSLFLLSCNDRNIARFNISNKSDYLMDSIRVSLSGHDNSSYYISLEPGQSKTLLLNMNDLPRVDGEYLLSYKNAGAGSGTQTFGCFTHGSPDEEITNITILNDTVTFDFSVNKYSYSD